MIIYYCLRNPKQTIVVRDYLKIRPDMTLILKIMAIGIPAGIENGMFQFGKIAISSTVSTMGTIAISAQAMTDMIVSVTSMWCCRVALSVFLVKTFHFGLWAVWIGIFTDWIVRACIFWARFISGKWLHKDMVIQKG